MILTNGMQINVVYEQPVEIKIEFPLSILYAYDDTDDLEITWDDNIQLLILEPLRQGGVYIKNSSLDRFPAVKNNDVILSLHMILVVRPPGFNLHAIVNSLTSENFQKGLCIKRKSDYVGFETIYADPFAIDHINN
jgi:hypothetical protein